MRTWLYAGGGLALVLTNFVFLGSVLILRPLGLPVLFDVFVGLYVLIFALGMSLAVHLAGAKRCWIEFRTAATRAEVVVATGWRGRHRQVIPMAALRRVVVRETRRLGRRSALEIVLDLRNLEVVTCKANIDLMKEISTGQLAGWLEEQLRPVGVGLRQETRTDREFQCPEQWWPAATVASAWQVPVSEVARIAFLRGVPAHSYTPRAYAMHSPNRTTTVYDPARVYDVAQECQAARSAQTTPGRPRSDNS